MMKVLWFDLSGCQRLMVSTMDVLKWRRISIGICSNWRFLRRISRRTTWSCQQVKQCPLGIKVLAGTILVPAFYIGWRGMNLMNIRFNWRRPWQELKLSKSHIVEKLRGKVEKENDDAPGTCIDQIELNKLVIKNKCSLTRIDACEISRRK